MKINQCEVRESGGHRCELEKGHSGKHYISQETILKHTFVPLGASLSSPALSAISFSDESE